MKVPLKWLQEYVSISLSPVELADRLTMAGVEVKGRQTIGGDWEKVVVGQIVAIAPHPNADRLRLVTVDLGTEQPTVVCGAPNVYLGDKVALAQVGAQLIDPSTGQSFRLKPAKIRGVVSSGMVCSERELGVSSNHEGIMILPKDAPVGSPLADYLSDTILDLEVTPNRPDCLSVIGIAREVAALTGQTVHLPEPVYQEAPDTIDQKVSVEIVAPDLCPRYCASLISGVKVAQSPVWMQRRLLACGVRPISNVVDVTNYVMLEYGQPLHAFDYHRISGSKIIVRRAGDKERLVTLDGTERTLSQNMLVIADRDRAVAVAGVMGGADSEVTSQTTAILLEAANFNPPSIHFTSHELSLVSEASMRFERGIRPELAVPALKRATQLIVEFGGGQAAKGLVDVYPGRRESPPISLSPAMVRRLLGVEFSLDRVVAVLASLGCDCKVSESEVSVLPPYWRSDINLPVDLVEEVARIIGYDQLPQTLLGQQLPRINPSPILGLKQKVSRSLVGYGFYEVITYSLVGEEALSKLSTQSRPVEPIRVANPMTAEQECLRPNLRANLLAAVATNQRHEEDGIRLFELGRVYLPRAKDLPEEPEIVCGVLSGPRSARTWLGGGELSDFYDAKGVVEGLLGYLGADARFETGQDDCLHPQKQAMVVVAGKRVGVVGELHPKVALAFELANPTCLFELNLTLLLPAVAAHKMYKPIPRFPAVVRDIALVVDDIVAHQQIEDVIGSFPLVSRAALFDVYVGKPMPVGKKSLAYRVTYQSPTHTLTDSEVDQVQQQILDRLAKDLGATLRA